MKNQKTYRGFSLLELVFTIVVIGIIATSIPMMLEVTPKVAKSKQIDRIFYEEFTIGELVTTHYFDENNSKGTNYFKDLNATGGDDELLLDYVYNDNPERIGKFQLKNQCRDGTDSDQNVSYIGLDSGETDGNVSSYDDVDDFNGYETNVTSDNYPVEVNVSYVSDDTNYSEENVTLQLSVNPVSQSNIKLIKIIGYFPDKSGQKIVYFIPVFNIGGTKYLSDNELGGKCE